MSNTGHFWGEVKGHQGEQPKAISGSNIRHLWGAKWKGICGGKSKGISGGKSKEIKNQRSMQYLILCSPQGTTFFGQHIQWPGTSVYCINLPILSSTFFRP